MIATSKLSTICISMYWIEVSIAYSHYIDLKLICCRKSIDPFPKPRFLIFDHLGAQVDSVISGRKLITLWSWYVPAENAELHTYIGGPWTWGDAWLMIFNQLCMTNSSVKGWGIWNSTSCSFCTSDLYVGISKKWIPTRRICNMQNGHEELTGALHPLTDAFVMQSWLKRISKISHGTYYLPR